MKLRSGKILNSGTDTLPKELNSVLETSLQKFKILFSSNPKYAKELLNIISNSSSIEILEKVNEVR